MCSLGGGGVFKGGRRLYVVAEQNNTPRVRDTDRVEKPTAAPSTSECRVTFQIPDGVEQVRGGVAGLGRGRGVRVSRWLELVFLHGWSKASLSPEGCR